MKKLLFLLVCTLLCSNISFANPVVYEKPDVKIIVEGSELELEAEVPIIVNSRTLVPLRKLLVGLGVPDNTENIQWIGETREVKVIYNGVNIALAIDSSKAYVNGVEYTLDSAPIIHRDRTYLPARFVGEALGYTISWDQYTPAVLVMSNENMDKLTELLNDLKSAMDNVKTYEVATQRITDVKYNYNGESKEESYKIVTLEKADFAKKTVYTESSYKDEFENSINLSYNTEDAFYNCYKYFEDGKIFTEKWEKYDYDPINDEETPFEGKEKVGLVKIDAALGGALLCKEYNNAYVLSTASEQIDILKSLDGSEMFEEIIGNGKAENFAFEIIIDKETKLPTQMKVNFDIIHSEDASGDVLGISSYETNEYFVEFLAYNQPVDIELPEV